MSTIRNTICVVCICKRWKLNFKKIESMRNPISKRNGISLALLTLKYPCIFLSSYKMTDSPKK